MASVSLVDSATREITDVLTKGWYVDSVAGDDTQVGRAPGSALKTLATVVGKIQNGDNIFLKRGSRFRERFNVSSFTDLYIDDYGTGDLPIVDGADIIQNWTLDSGNVYTASVTHQGSGSDRLTVYEDGVLLTRFETTPEVENNPGSFRADRADTANPLTVYLHPSDSGDPTTNGKTYEVGLRPVIEPGQGNELQDIIGIRGVANNGPVDAVDIQDQTMRRVISKWGTKHNLGWGSGTIEDCVCYVNDPPTSWQVSATHFVAFLSDAAGFTAIGRRLFSIGTDVLRTATAMISHDVAGNGYDQVELYQVAAVKLLSGWAPRAATTIQDGLFYDDVDRATVGFSDDMTVRRVQDRVKLTVSGHFEPNPTNSGTCVISDSVFEAVAASFTDVIRFTDPGTYTMSGLAFYSSGSRGGLRTLNDNVKAITLNNSVFDIGQTNTVKIDNPSETYTGDHNIFTGDASLAVHLRWQGSTHTTLSAWQTATSQDANSCVTDADDQGAGSSRALWLAHANAAAGTDLSTIGPAVGDFRINPDARVYDASGNPFIGAFPDSTALTDAGPQTHWDWNARASATGPPTSWPDVPDSEADAETYVKDPEGWTF